MKKTILICLFEIYYCSGFSQKVCNNVDSVVIRYFPSQLFSPMAITEANFYNNISKELNVRTIVDSEQLVSFSKIELKDSTRFSGSSNTQIGIDLRIIMEVYDDGFLIDKILMDRSRQYIYRNKYYLSSSELTFWCIKNTKD